MALLNRKYLQRVYSQGLVLLLSYTRAVSIVAIFHETVGHSHFEFLFCAEGGGGGGVKLPWHGKADVTFMCILLEVGGCKYCIFMYLIYVIV
jgi:hypothetical protein